MLQAPLKGLSVQTREQKTQKITYISRVMNFWWFVNTHSNRCFRVTALPCSRSILASSTYDPISLSARRVSRIVPSIQARLPYGNDSQMAVFSPRSRNASSRSFRTRAIRVRKTRFSESTSLRARQNSASLKVVLIAEKTVPAEIVNGSAMMIV